MTVTEPALAPAARLLTALFTRGALPHALLIEGGAEAQRRAAAVALARAVLCWESQGNAGETEMFGGASLFGPEEPAERALPCEACAHCRKSREGVHPDLQILEGGAGARSFHIEAVRALRLDCAVLPNEAGAKVYVLHNAHTMTVEAQNALLKLLEEPPAYACLILTAPARKLLLPTVISRVSVLSLGEAVREAAQAEREELVQGHARRIAAAMLAGRGAWPVMEAAAPLDGDRDLTRETLPALRRQLHEQLTRGANAPRALRCVEAVRELEAALDRNANLNLLLANLAASAFSF